MASKEYKLDVFKTLEHIAKKDYKFWDTLTDEQIKGFQPLVVQQWMCGVDDGLQIFLVNTVVNNAVFQLSNHKQLLFQLMCAASTTKQRCKWTKKKPLSNFPKALKVLSEYTGDAKKICKDYFFAYTNEEIVLMCEELGYQKKEIADLKRELKKRD